MMYQEDAQIELSDSAFDSDEALPGGLWDPEQGQVVGGVNRGEFVGEDLAL